jgi:hypothetical protein
MVNPGGPGRRRQGRLRRWPAAASRAGRLDSRSGLGCMHGSLLAHGCQRR